MSTGSGMSATGSAMVSAAPFTGPAAPYVAAAGVVLNLAGGKVGGKSGSGAGHVDPELQKFMANMEAITQGQSFVQTEFENAFKQAESTNNFELNKGKLQSDWTSSLYDRNMASGSSDFATTMGTQSKDLATAGKYGVPGQVYGGGMYGGGKFNAPGISVGPFQGYPKGPDLQSNYLKFVNNNAYLHPEDKSADPASPEASAKHYRDTYPVGGG